MFTVVSTLNTEFIPLLLFNLLIIVLFIFIICLLLIVIISCPYLRFIFEIKMADNLTNDQRKWILKEYWKTENAETFRQKWAEEFDTPPPSRQTIYRIRDKFHETGYICNTPKSVRPVSVTTQENEMSVSQAITKKPPPPKNRNKELLWIWAFPVDLRFF